MRRCHPLPGVCRRIQTKPHEITWQQVEEEAVTGKTFVSPFADKAGRSVVVMRPRWGGGRWQATGSWQPTAGAPRMRAAHGHVSIPYVQLQVLACWCAGACTILGVAHGAGLPPERVHRVCACVLLCAGTPPHCPPRMPQEPEHQG
jgi:hypothetical protein